MTRSHVMLGLEERVISLCFHVLLAANWTWHCVCNSILLIRVASSFCVDPLPVPKLLRQSEWVAWKWSGLCSVRTVVSR